MVEYFMWTRILPDNPAFPKTTPGEWASLAWMNLLSPLLAPALAVERALTSRRNQIYALYFNI